MRIGLVLAKTPGYSETFFRSKIKGLQEAGNEVVLFTQHRANDFDLCEVQIAPKVFGNPLAQGMAFLVIYFSLLPYFSKIYRFWKLERSVGKSVPSIIKSIYLNAHILKTKLNWLHFGFATMALGKEQVSEAIGAKMGVSFRGFDINVYPLKHPNCYQLLWKKVDKVHSISNYLLEEAWKLGLSKDTPVVVITPAVDIDRLPKPEFNFNPKALQISTLARLHWIKGLDISIKAMAQMKRNGINFKYHIVGDGDIKQRERYQFLAYELGIQEDVVFHGRLSHDATLELLQKSHLYLQPSLNEGFCNAILEAQSLGIPTIASRAGGIPENIEEGVTGRLFTVGDVNDLLDVLQEMIHLSESQLKEMSHASIRRVREKFSIREQKKKFQEFYQL